MTKKYFSRTVFCLTLLSAGAFLLTIFFASFAFAESITLTTYYPAPYGVYKQMSSDTLVVGLSTSGTPIDIQNEHDHMESGEVHIRKSLIVGSDSSNFAYNSPTGPVIDDGDAILKRSLGIGTTDHVPEGGIVAVGTYSSGTDLTTSNAGTRLIWYPKKAALRAGIVTGSQWNDGSIGNISVALGEDTIASAGNSLAMGKQTTASGSSSTAMGRGTTASGDESTAMGSNTRAQGSYSTAMGYYSTASGIASTAMGSSAMASGDYSTAIGLGVEASGKSSVAMGKNATAQSYASVALGQFNVISGTTDSWQWNEPVFVIGNGTGAAPADRHNAVTVLKNGRVGIGETSPLNDLHITAADPFLRFEDNLDGGSVWRIGVNDNLFQVVEMVTGATTQRLVIKDGGNVGIGTDDPQAKLNLKTDDGELWLQMDKTEHASGIRWREGGATTWWAGVGAGGQFHIRHQPSEVISTFTIKQGGNVGIRTLDPEEELHIKADAEPDSAREVWMLFDRYPGRAGGIRFREGSTEQFWAGVASGDRFTIKPAGASFENGLFMDPNANVGIKTYYPTAALTIDGDIHRTGDCIKISDERLKENIVSIDDAISKIRSINGVYYNMIGSDRRKLGVIAQNVQKVLPEAVSVVDPEKGYLGVDYTNIVPVLIEAIKAQQQQIDELRAQLNLSKR